ncbi:predicted protein [Histoplasma mississippiense (nom. inval.)]|uniref:predicted protein n=1 Tax=Ajellomyces capsulatus (strain NAm1 / WU24) TaxID=2059318 RepID=UPI000157D589|nr:predicted protein [Histoplasma mississippiense (nom. inval.)]EDN05432.1 predicted protein [Histoplasma mississippiense (nom. inval.)]
MDVRSLLNPPDEGERKVIAAVASTEKISQPPSITQGQINFPHREQMTTVDATCCPHERAEKRYECSVNTLRNPAPSTPTGKKRSAAVVEDEERRISVGYSHGNASGENQPWGGSHIQTGNTEHLRTHYDFTISNPDAPATPGFLPTPTPVQITPAPATVSSTLFPDGWVPDPYVSPQLEDVLKFKTASLGVPHDPEPPETTIMIHHYDVEELPFEILTSEAARIYDVILTTEMGCLAEDANISCVGKLSENQWINLVKWHRSLIDHHYDLLIYMVPGLKNLWLECLGDLTSYMMCLEDTDSDERETWNEISSSWYHKALDENPGKGSLYHRLGNLSKPNMEAECHPARLTILVCGLACYASSRWFNPQVH